MMAVKYLLKISASDDNEPLDFGKWNLIRR